MDSTRSGVYTTEFWLVVVANVLVQLKTLPFPSRYNWVVLVGTLVGYSISRGLAKLGGKTVITPAPPVPDQGDAGKA